VHSKFVNGFKKIRGAEQTSIIIEVFGYVVALFDGTETENNPIEMCHSQILIWF
jgi:hypothetical protein